MILKQKYKSLDETLGYLKIQVIDSIPYASQVCPKVKDPRELFRWLKSKVRYQNDPAGTELLQTMPTMFRNGGRGDCDCFVITTLACLIVNGFTDIKIILVGRRRAFPVHIYTIVYEDGKRIVFDLTNKRYNYERPGYNYFQELPVNWEKWNINKLKF